MLPSIEKLESTFNQSMDVVLKSLNTVETKMETLQKQLTICQNGTTQVLTQSLTDLAEQLQKVTTQALQLSSPIATCSTAIASSDPPPATSNPLPTSLATVVAPVVPEPQASQLAPAILENDENPEDFVPDIDYVPVVKLPEIVQVFTGEEFEDGLFESRIKLYIFNPETKEIKERGTGGIKILYSPKTKSHRFVMRREHVHTLCANFRINEGMSITDKTGTKNCGILNCKDYSDDDENGTHCVFIIRFQDDDGYKTFKELFMDIAAGNPDVYYDVEQYEGNGQIIENVEEIYADDENIEEVLTEDENVEEIEYVYTDDDDYIEDVDEVYTDEDDGENFVF